MRYWHFLTITIIALFAYTGKVSGQANPELVSGEFLHTTIDSFVQELEHQTTYKYYYELKDFDSMRISLSVKDKPLPEVLNLAFANTDFYYAIDGHKQVFFS